MADSKVVRDGNNVRVYMTSTAPAFGLEQFQVKQGDQVTVILWRARDGSKLAHALTLTAPDGRVMNFPRDWAMPASSK